LEALAMFRRLHYRTLALLAAAALVPVIASAGGPVHVRGYFRSNGTYVAPHYRSAPDGNFHNNWSTKGNYNPYTGEAGTRVTPPSYRGSYHSHSESYLQGSYNVPSYSPSYRTYPSLGNTWHDNRSGFIVNPYIQPSQTRELSSSPWGRSGGITIKH